ncbi:CaiB/BaiF CoA transferase family protein [Peribacillus asahii]|uniref:CaiB/BaiF CoA transferase family protein n=1 Tax=Peribacillus asahii TaxID=228899 RepID=UPI00380D04B5
MTLLSNLKVLDFSTLLPGPFATLLLADLGADVIRVERPSGVEAWAMDPYLNRSKQSITLDLKKQESIEAVKKLVEEYDIILEQFRPGVMERLGLGYETLKQINPRLIYCSITGFGQTGPYKDRPGHDINYVSMAGLSSYSGTKKEGPAKNGTQIADIAGGSMHAVAGILAAALYREQTGEGQYIDISMTDCSFTLNALSAPMYLNDGIDLEPEDMLLNGGTFYDFYETKDGRYVSVGSLEPVFRKRLCEGIGRPELFEMSMSEEPEQIREFKEIVREAFLTKTFTEWNDIFTEIEACVEPVLTFAEACEHPHMKARGMLVDVANVHGGNERQIACPIKFSSFTPNYKYVGLSPGASNEKILGEQWKSKA